MNKKKKNQYYLLAHNLDFDTFKRIKKFPIFNKGQNKGGFIVRREFFRLQPVSNFGHRLLGFDNHKGQVGLEGAYSKYLKGQDIMRFEQRINAKQWKPVNCWYKDPSPGYDVYTTIDVGMQEIVYSALLQQLIKFEADRGCAILMEVSTGRIKAMINLKKTEKGDYQDLRNYGIYEMSEPGSTFKVMSLLVAMDDGYIDSNTTIDIGKGKWNIHNMVVTDDYGSGVYNLEKVLTKSSNVGASKLIYKYYANNPNNFYKKLHDWKLDEPLGVEIKGEAHPKFPLTGSKHWSSQSLITSSYGYGIHLTPLQILTFYNGIANNGRVLKPKFLEQIKSNGKIIKSFNSEIRVNKLSSQKNINQMKNILIKVVQNGTAKSIYSSSLKMAGKTGTTRLEYWKENELKQYQSSFCGFFPSDNPMFSCIVVIQKPKLKKGIYGGIVAAPVFKNIVSKIFLRFPLNLHQNFVNSNNKLYEINLMHSKVQNLENIKYIPNLIGQIGFDIIPQLENLGLKVKCRGTGKITKQSLSENTPIKKGQIIYLELE